MLQFPMHIQVITNPDRKITQTVLYFQFRFMGWTSNDMIEQDDRYGTLPFGYVIAYEGDKIVGVLNLLKRKILFQGKPILVGGFGGVCTHSDYRKQGVATKMLKAGSETLKEQKCDIAFLCTDIKNIGKVYANVGFKPLNRKYRATGLSGKIYESYDGMVAPVNSPDIFEQVLNDTATFDLQGQDW